MPADALAKPGTNHGSIHLQQAWATRAMPATHIGVYRRQGVHGTEEELCDACCVVLQARQAARCVLGFVTPAHWVHVPGAASRYGLLMCAVHCCKPKAAVDVQQL
jgi:hypothetical protein